MSLETIAGLLSGSRRVRREALEDLDPRRREHCFALRQVLWLDRDAGLRARAAERLGSARASQALAAAWLREALADPYPSVRDAAYRSLARQGDRDTIPLARRAAFEEPIWWVRRTAVHTLAALDEEGAIDALCAVLDDPFWRVRHAAVQSLAIHDPAAVLARARAIQDCAIPIESIGVPIEPGGIPVSSPAARPALGVTALRALEYLTGARLAQAGAPAGPNEDRAEGSVPAATLAAGPSFSDPDPAVVTARVEAQAHSRSRKGAPPRPAPSPLSLTDWLADPHQPLREAVVRRLVRSPDHQALLAATRWLEEPRIPQAGETVRALLDALGEPAGAIAAAVLGDASRPGAQIWAIEWVRATRCEELYDAVREAAAAADVRVRRAATAALGEIGPEETLIAALDAPDPEIRAAAITGLTRGRTPSAQRALASVRCSLQSPAARRALVEVAARLGDAARLREAAEDTDPIARSLAIRALGLAEVPAAASDPDPWVRAAALDLTSAQRALAGDPDAGVRRRALLCLLAGRRRLTAAERAAAGLCAAALPDPWARARACELLDPARDDDLAALLGLCRDPSPMVRAAALDPLQTCADLYARLTSLLARGAETGEARAAAYALLLREPDEAAFTKLAAALADPDEPPVVIELLRAMALLHPASRVASAPHVAAALPERTESARSPGASRANTTAEAALRRPLGSTGLSVSPLGLSGAYQPPRASIEHAHASGVNLFFWEPHHTTLTRFLRRRRDVVIVAGSYHAAGPALERDVDAALRRLGADTLDLFLLFWVRSPARIDGEAFEAMARLRRAGKIRAAGFSTHLRDLACDAITSHPWDVVMTRHSAAHPGAESRLFPLAAARGAGILTFSALSYGRLLRGGLGRSSGDVAKAAPPEAQSAPSAADEPPSAADCYRYSVSQPGVSACWSAPRWHREIVENLGVLSNPLLDEATRARLRAIGERVHAEGRRFASLVRAAPAEPPVAAPPLLAREQRRELALALLDEQGPPEEAFASDPAVIASAPRRDSAMLAELPGFGPS